MTTISLNGTWELRDEPLSLDLAEARRLTTQAEGWIPTPVPGDVHQGLVAAGRIEEPLLGLNSFDCRWTEDRSWWFRRAFRVDPGWLAGVEEGGADVVELALDGLDSNGAVFVNGAHVGSHRSAFYPFVMDVKPWLHLGENVLLVRLTAGVETVSALDADSTRDPRLDMGGGGDEGPGRGDPRRAHVRKPQYTFGWDWSPRLATTAIGGDVTLRAMRQACIRRVNLRPVRGDGGEVRVVAVVTVDKFHYYRTAAGGVTVTLTGADGRSHGARCEALLRSGHTFVEVAVPLADPQLWWPNGSGEQHLYRVRVDLDVEGQVVDSSAFDYGLRFVELDALGRFSLLINGERIFGRGANWTPGDALYARVDEDRIETLVREARDANFNMLRVWGGGRYEPDAFYRACDRYGIMVWQDFIFACAPYPDHLDWFRAEVEREADYQTKRLQRHACVVLWCGNNENSWAFKDWWDERTDRGAQIYNRLLPDAVQRNCPEIPYWNGSPYGGDGPNSPEVGDCHYWNAATMHEDVERRITPEVYDACTSAFVSEFGIIGACGEETVRTYLDGAPFERGGEVWRHHENTYVWDTVEAAIARHYADPAGLATGEYLLYSGLFQGMMLEYALEAMRYRADCYGSLFWMYDDCWGEVGWTILDYYLRRKPSWYFVRRAFAPVRLILRAQGEDVRVVAANDTREPVALELEVGYVSLDGSLADLETHRVEAAAMARTALCTFPRGDHDPARGLWIARAAGGEVLPAVLRAVDYRQLEGGDPALAVRVVSREGDSCVVEVGARRYAHAVHFTAPPGLLPSDDYFDLLPGETRQVAVVLRRGGAPDEIAVTCVNASSARV